ncbi:GntR family transcriptional regulator [Aureibacillus halotolerans]|uniref:GntR family transcriptional regulator n=1 Tax=Aureibacillus halotolerans TaxID=1508390 RepID=A0A4R6UCY7_9BACI|nr:GntR family transcriptional regulator [Aureibacillus halotolerans]TDQ42625.1 GntR family transcriptional regulator [Aureibacillus halotolerans]
MKFTSVDGQPKKSIGEFTYDTLKNKILTLELRPGQKISENEIARKLDVSRAPVRDSFVKLAQEKLLDIYPQSGTVVSLIQLDYVEEGRFVREHIERAIVKQACEVLSEDHLFQLESNLMMQELCEKKGNHSKLFELDNEFHKLLFYGCGKIRTWEMMEFMNSHFNRLRQLRVFSTLEWSEIIAQHKHIYELIKQKLPDQADQRMSDHLRLVFFEKDCLVARFPDYFKL